MGIWNTLAKLFSRRAKTLPPGEYTVKIVDAKLQPDGTLKVNGNVRDIRSGRGRGTAPPPPGSTFDRTAIPRKPATVNAPSTRYLKDDDEDERRRRRSSDDYNSGFLSGLFASTSDSGTSSSSSSCSSDSGSSSSSSDSGSCGGSTD